MHVIQLDHITINYAGRVIFADLSWAIGDRARVGLVGPNGAGKSTTLRCLVGLAHADSGTATLLGRRYADLANPGASVGVLLDASAQHVGRTGREILTLGARTIGVPDARVAEALDLVQLTTAEARRRVGTYSLGMRQRLGLAHALLGSPEVLILDEPANGLDPQGIVWMRALLRRFADAGGTVLLSSHLLHEVQQIADDLVMIGNGRVVAQGSVADLLSAGRSLEDLYLELAAPTARTSQIGAVA